MASIVWGSMGRLVNNLKRGIPLLALGFYFASLWCLIGTMLLCYTVTPFDLFIMYMYILSATSIMADFHVFSQKNSHHPIIPKKQSSSHPPSSALLVSTPCVPSFYSSLLPLYHCTLPSPTPPTAIYQFPGLSTLKHARLRFQSWHSVMRENMGHLSFPVWITSLRMIVSSFIHLPVNAIISFF